LHQASVVRNIAIAAILLFYVPIVSSCNDAANAETTVVFYLQNLQSGNRIKALTSWEINNVGLIDNDIDARQKQTRLTRRIELEKSLADILINLDQAFTWQVDSVQYYSADSGKYVETSQQNQAKLSTVRTVISKTNISPSIEIGDIGFNLWKDTSDSWKIVGLDIEVLRLRALFEALN